MKFSQWLNESIKIGDVTLKKIASRTTSKGNFVVYDTDNSHHPRSDMFIVQEDKNGWIIQHSFVPKELQRKGLSTNFFSEMNKLSLKKTKKPLRSIQPDEETDLIDLTKDGEKLWNGLVKKGLATKISDKLYQFKN